MLALVVVASVGIVVWRVWAPAMAWTPAFAGLLDRPVRKTGFLPFMIGLETAGGDYEGRPVFLALHHKRDRHSPGYLVVAMQPRTVPASGQDALAAARAGNGRHALDELESREGLHVSLDGGWLKARWQPGGFAFFPGTFDPARWRRVLRAMSAVAAALEADRV